LSAYIYIMSAYIRKTDAAYIHFFSLSEKNNMADKKINVFRFTESIA